jgi:hypothetical protein
MTPTKLGAYAIFPELSFQNPDNAWSICYFAGAKILLHPTYWKHMDLVVNYIMITIPYYLYIFRVVYPPS